MNVLCENVGGWEELFTIFSGEFVIGCFPKLVGIRYELPGMKEHAPRLRTLGLRP